MVKSQNCFKKYIYKKKVKQVKKVKKSLKKVKQVKRATTTKNTKKQVKKVKKKLKKSKKSKKSKKKYKKKIIITHTWQGVVKCVVKLKYCRIGTTIGVVVDMDPGDKKAKRQKKSKK